MLEEFQQAGKGVWRQGRLIHHLQRACPTINLLDYYFFKSATLILKCDPHWQSFLALVAKGRQCLGVPAVRRAHVYFSICHTCLSLQTVLSWQAGPPSYLSLWTQNW